jgi:LysR family transcriptional regulator, glycine cleavage system transcriptional activator
MATRRLRPCRSDIAAVSLKTSQLLALQAFDVAVRLGSFKAAALALNLSASAISHRVRHLEQAMGVNLFTRTHRAVHPTAAGKSLALSTGRAFAELARSGTTGPSGRRRLRMKAFPLFASAWLIPRLADFTAKYPEVDISIETSSRIVDFNVEAFDANICVGDGRFDGLDALHLADLRSTPIAAPHLADRLRLKKPTDLQRATLIHVTTFPKAWSEWLEAAGVPKLKPVRTIAVDTFVAAIQAAEQGAGVALGMDLFIAERERQGTIRRLFQVGSPTGSYWFVHTPESRRNRTLQLFKRWLLAELASGSAPA